MFVFQVGSNAVYVKRVRPTWKQVVVTSSFHTEMEYTAFQSQGCVKTRDGREITFGVEVEMSRAFCEKYDSVFMQDMPVTCDPLVLNLEGDIGKISTLPKNSGGSSNRVLK